MEVYLIRHTTPKVDKGICYGQTDLALASTFLEEKEEVLRQLPLQLDVVYSSPLQRCQLLAASLPARRLILDSRLQELHFGQWEMQPWDSIPKAALDPWMQDFVNVAPAGGESFLQMKERVMASWQKLLATDHSRIAVVTHAGVIRLLMAVLHDKPLTEAFKLTVKYGEVIKLELA